MIAMINKIIPSHTGYVLLWFFRFDITCRFIVFICFHLCGTVFGPLVTIKTTNCMVAIPLNMLLFLT
jgi:hypothetical protein